MDISMVYFIISLLISYRICKKVLGFYNIEKRTFYSFDSFRDSKMFKK